MTCQGCGNPIEPSGPKDHRRKWCSERCRKGSYGQPCVDCGARTSYGAEQARIPEPRCRSCAAKHYLVKWDRELVVKRIREWNVRYGSPPGQADWHTGTARRLRDEERARRFLDASGYWPSLRSTTALFGSWNAAIEAAGFESRGRGGGNQYHRRDLRAGAAS